MTAIPSSWLIGTITLTASATIVVDAVNNAVIPAGTYYVRDATASISFIDVVLAAVTPFMTTPAIFIGQDRKIRVTAGALFTWTIPAELQGALGFGASIPSTSSATATDVSELLWSPGYCATTVGHPNDTQGWSRSQRSHLASASGLSADTVINGTDATLTGLRWAFVVRGRAWSAGEQLGLPGDYRRFYLEVLNPGHRWKRYEMAAEDEASGAAAVYPALVFGPYKAAKLKEDWWTRSVANTDRMSNIPQLDGVLTSEVA